MPAPTKDVMLRTWEMLELIPQRGPGKTARQLLEELRARGYDVCKKTVERDLSELSTIFPIMSNESVKPYLWYWSPEGKLDIPAVALTEALSLVLVEDTLSGLMHRSLLAPLKGRIDAAKQLIAESQSINATAGWAGKIRSMPRDLTLQTPSVKTGVFERVQDALLSDRQLEIEYRSLSDMAPRWRTVNPRLLLLKGSVMYVVADGMTQSGTATQNPLKQYALHRIHAAKLSTVASVPRLFNIAKYLKSEAHEVGGRQALRIRLQVSANLAKILSETPLAPKQRIKVSGTTIVVEAAVRDTLALRRWILGHGSAVKVLGPAALRARVRDEVRAAAAGY